jgi:hypothetical protein
MHGTPDTSLPPSLGGAAGHGRDVESLVAAQRSTILPLNARICRVSRPARAWPPPRSTGRTAHPSTRTVASLIRSGYGSLIGVWVSGTQERSVLAVLRADHQHSCPRARFGNGLAWLSVNG